MALIWLANSVAVKRTRSGDTKATAEAIDPGSIANLYPTISAILAEMGSKTLAGYMQTSPDRAFLNSSRWIVISLTSL
jgi:hypothetical protein